VKVFSSWSGGKESALATYKAISQGHEVMYLLNFISEDGQRSRSHGTKASVLALQAEATGIPIIQVKTSWEDYEENFKKTVREMKSQGIEGGVFGDMEVEEHREWVERVCSEVGIKAFLPLWGTRPEELIEEFLKLRFKAIIVATRLDETFLGKALDKALLEQIKRVGSHPCGENGEYHTFVTEAPIFRKSFKVTGGELKKKDSMWFWDISANMIAQDSPSCRCEEHSDETVPLDSSPTQEERVPRGVYPEQR
jgi:diphthine-ammonia ligase